MGEPFVNFAALTTVVITTRNRRCLLENAVDSVRDQTHVNWELIVVDDASTDDTREWLRRLSDPRVSFCQLEARSERSLARNEGLQRAQGDYVLFLDDDDVLCPDALNHLTQMLEREPLAIAAVGGAEVFSEHGTYRGARPWRSHVVRSPWIDALGGWCALVGQSLFRTEPLRSLGGFNREMIPSEDQELWLRAGRSPVVFGRERVLQVRSHEGQGSRLEGDLTKLQLDMRTDFIESLPVEQQVLAKRAIAYWIHARAAQSAYISGDLKGFRRHIYRAARANPKLLSSPLMRPGLMRKLAKATLPSQMLFGLRAVRAQAGRGVLIHGRP